MLEAWVHVHLHLRELGAEVVMDLPGRQGLVVAREADERGAAVEQGVGAAEDGVSAGHDGALGRLLVVLVPDDEEQHRQNRGPPVGAAVLLPGLAERPERQAMSLGDLLYKAHGVEQHEPCWPQRGVCVGHARVVHDHGAEVRAQGVPQQDVAAGRADAELSVEEPLHGVAEGGGAGDGGLEVRARAVGDLQHHQRRLPRAPQALQEAQVGPRPQADAVDEDGRQAGGLRVAGPRRPVAEPALGRGQPAALVAERPEGSLCQKPHPSK
mmetsp:Transcript_111454/g.326020  ORF Transcript_111454/g.326020 Transcript_111454/m.326020 type:complete len:268 (+) Transcript_111454:313-1116(+)